MEKIFIAIITLSVKHFTRLEIKCQNITFQRMSCAELNSKKKAIQIEWLYRIIKSYYTLK